MPPKCILHPGHWLIYAVWLHPYHLVKCPPCETELGSAFSATDNAASRAASSEVLPGKSRRNESRTDPSRIGLDKVRHWCKQYSLPIFVAMPANMRGWN